MIGAVHRATIKLTLKMIKNYKFIIIPVCVLLLGCFIFFFLKNDNAALMHPKGLIAISERNLAATVVGIMMIIAIPVYILVTYTAIKYRDTNKKNKYTPDSIPSRLTVLLWWLIPTIIILILAVINWNSSHALDPFKPLDSNVAPLKIQVIALRWKWLFIYPDQDIATVNFIEFPINTPVNFELTADAPMSSFWIPKLSGQIYAMTGMGTKIHTITSIPGDYDGSATEINGSGFAGMKFIARASTESDFNKWVQKVKTSQKTMNMDSYQKLSTPSEYNPVDFYSTVDPDLYNKVIDKFLPAMK